MIVRLVFAAVYLVVLALVVVPPVFVAAIFPTTWGVLACLGWMCFNMWGGSWLLGKVP